MAQDTHLPPQQNPQGAPANPPAPPPSTETPSPGGTAPRPEPRHDEPLLHPQDASPRTEDGPEATRHPSPQDMARHAAPQARPPTLPPPRPPALTRSRGAPPASQEPLIELTRVTREYPSGDGTVAVLKGIDLTIARGEMVAIVGASGSGKSTLMNILGCLDRPSSGSYRISGRETSQLSPDELAALRREHFGFIFQRYNLLPELTALGNVEVPAIYAGRARGEREPRAASLLGRLGLADKVRNRPNQLSGGQQQRVSIARALMNGAEVILADEPTGALDTASGQEVLRILDELHAEGRTVIIVTHDPGIAARAERIIEIRDGEIIGDHPTGRVTPPALAEIGSPFPGGPPPDGPLSRGQHPGSPLPDGPLPADLPPADPPAHPLPAPARSRRAGPAMLATRLREAFLMALTAMNAHKLRTFLTMLGIIIGIASVVSVVALGAGSRQQVLANISSLGTNTLEIFAGRDFGDTRSGRITTLVVSDAQALSLQPYVAAVTPTVSTSKTIRYGATEVSTLVNGVGEQFFDARGAKLVAGRLFDAGDVAGLSQDAVIDENTLVTLFPDGDAVGKVVLIGNVPVRITGVVQVQQGFGPSQNLSVYLPYTTVQSRFLGSTSLRSITVRVADAVDTNLAEQAVTQLLTQRHGTKDFFILNTDDIRQTITATTQALTLLIASIAVISLVVGGIGVMNIMLVSVSERVSEIGVRMAVGARAGDILQQFLIEAVLVCLIGGFLGVAAALAFGYVFSLVSTTFTLIYSPASIVAAFLSSTLIGVVFGYLPARNASRLDPVVALSKA
ncbi:MULTISPECIES: MacB family efflux pump subunit [unclassified Haematobacter]|uniref:MacB family efflux pump subunit n=1 Tax=unclassified Haematobacter TaxID=2640585 RepID=UPI0025B8FEEF|nr:MULTISPECIES: MacB family efflux pump subunit [unclassified Haematobacter]